MLSLASLLNPAPPGPPILSRFHSIPTVSSPASSSCSDDLLPPPQQQPPPTPHHMSFDQQHHRHDNHQCPTSLTSAASSSLVPRLRMARESTASSSLGASHKSNKPRGAVKFPPFEASVVDEASLRQIRRFRVTPFGRIQECCAHIPYNSGKKDFFVKTGRESFEVFKYDFQVPDDDTEYTVMWDYNVGLVRMTPFFKCCQYGKTMPAKMLNMNPGLKDITHSITGGAISAQGYWMPYFCAKAVCATFCHNIAGALIPIFGPDFPAQCISPDAPDFGRMIIHPQIVADATSEAEAYRRLYQSSSIGLGIGPIFTSAGVSTIRPSSQAPSPPQEQIHSGRSQIQYLQHQESQRKEAGDCHHQRRDDGGGRYLEQSRAQHRDDRRLRLKTRHLCDKSPYSTDTDGDGHCSGPDSASSTGTTASPALISAGYMYTSSSASSSAMTSRGASGWTAANHHRRRGNHSLRVGIGNGGGSPGGGDNLSHPFLHDERFHQASPWLSAVPRFAPSMSTTATAASPHMARHHHDSYPSPRSLHQHRQHDDAPPPSVAPRLWSPTKRPVEYLDDSTAEYDAGPESNTSGSSPATASSVAGTIRPQPLRGTLQLVALQHSGPLVPASTSTSTSMSLSSSSSSSAAAAAAAVRRGAVVAIGAGLHHGVRDRSTDVAEKKAALLLMNLSVQDSRESTGDGGGSVEGEIGFGGLLARDDDRSGHRSKRRRATSM